MLRHTEDRELRMQELTPVTVRAETSFMKLDARFGLEIWRKMSFFDKFMLPMSKGTSVFPKTRSVDLPITAHLCLYLGSIGTHKLITILFTCEVLLRFLYGGHLIEISRLPV